MTKIVLFGTGNQNKKDRFQKLLKPLSIKVLSLKDVDIEINVKEDGKTPAENAAKKVKAYFSASQIPTFSIDYGLYIDKFPKSKQPGLSVRRIFGTEKEASDVQMLKYYVSELRKLGGESNGRWISAVALCIGENRIFQKTFSEKTHFVSKKSPIITPGEPLNSIQIHPITKRYKSEMSVEERAKAQDRIDRGFLKFFKQKLKYL